jgi:hypothetical protein
MEDSETMTTEIYLRADRTIVLGVTDGPRHMRGGGSWNERLATTADDASSPRTFDMTLVRTYLGGKVKNYDRSDWGYRVVDGTDIGEFAYSVRRHYAGEVSLVGRTVLSISGIVSDVDDVFGRRDVGYFNMIDTTQERIHNSVSSMMLPTSSGDGERTNVDDDGIETYAMPTGGGMGGILSS